PLRSRAGTVRHIRSRSRQVWRTVWLQGQLTHTDRREPPGRSVLMVWLVERAAAWDCHLVGLEPRWIDGRRAARPRQTGLPRPDRGDRWSRTRAQRTDAAPRAGRLRAPRLCRR